MEWAKANGVKLNVIITTSNLTDERRSEATKLGAAGICNTVPDLNSLITAITRKPIVLPEGVFSSNEASDPARSAFRKKSKKNVPRKPIDKTVRIISDLKDEAFLERLTASLTIGDYQVIDDRQKIRTGDTWRTGRTELSQADATLIILSKGAEADFKSRALIALNESFRFIWGYPTVTPDDVIPIVLFDLPGSSFERVFRNLKYIDFSRDYQSGLEELVDLLRHLPNRRPAGPRDNKH